jgi:hypothetical protein
MVLGTGEIVGIAIGAFAGLMLGAVAVEGSGIIDPPGQGGVARGKKSHSKSKKRTKKNK